LEDHLEDVTRLEEVPSFGEAMKAVEGTLLKASAATNFPLLGKTSKIASRHHKAIFIDSLSL
jgi:hypothetical protein